jgi:hypothetical protein
MKLPKARLLLLSIFFTTATTAQLRIVTNNDLRNNLAKVVADFPKELNTIKGEMIAENPQSVEFATLLKFEGAESNTITKYNSQKPIYSWQAIVLTSEDFEEATKKYKWLYNQLKAMTLNMGDLSFTLNGSYDKPEESKKFSASTFVLLPAATNLPKLKIEVGLQFYFPEWKVMLTVYQKEREDKERGNLSDD